MFAIVLAELQVSFVKLSEIDNNKSAAAVAAAIGDGGTSGDATGGDVGAHAPTRQLGRAAPDADRPVGADIAGDRRDPAGDHVVEGLVAVGVLGATDESNVWIGSQNSLTIEL